MACTAPLVGAESDSGRRTVTIVFSDLVGSTALGESLDPEALREVLDRYFDAMRECLERFGGTVEKYIGDAIMAVFGLPRAHEDDASRATLAASAMRDRLASLNQELEASWGVRLTNRTGVQTGEVVTGDPSTGLRLVTGDAVNTAARLEQAAPPGESPARRAHLSPRGPCRHGRGGRADRCEGQGRGRIRLPPSIRTAGGRDRAAIHRNHDRSRGRARSTRRRLPDRRPQSPPSRPAGRGFSPEHRGSSKW